MGTETRIGIVAGLLIVVVASVYFFYGSGSDKDEFVVATGSRLADPAKTGQPLKIPVGDGRNRPAAPTSASKTPAKTPAIPSKPASPLDKGPAIASKPPAPGIGQPSALPGSPRATTPPAVTPGAGATVVANRPASSPIMGPPSVGATPRQPETSATPLARAEPRASGAGSGINGAGKPSVGSEKPAERDPAERLKTTVLRTGAAKELLEATRENIEKAVSRATTSAPNEDSTVTSANGSRLSRAEPQKRSASPPEEHKDSKDAKAGPSARETPVAAAPTANAPSGWPKQHKIASGETITTLAQYYYGDGSRTSGILEANPKLNPRRLKIGETIVIPAPKGAPPAAPKAEAKLPSETVEKATTAKPAEVAQAGEAKKTPQDTASKTYQVREGDTFYSIAKGLYGNSARWMEIYQLNKTVLKNDPKHLKPGMVLKLPAS